MYSEDGIEGISAIMHNANIMGYKIKQDKYSARAIGTKGTGFISSQGLTAEQGKVIATQMKSQQEAGKIPFLGTQGDTKWNNQMITPNEAQYIETKYQTNTEIYGIFRLPPAFAQNYERATYANAEQQDNVYVKHTLTPFLRMIEQECDRKLFRENNLNKSFPFFTKFNVNGILRGDIATRFKMYHDMILDGVFSADDVLGFEDMPSQPNGLGEKYYMQGAMIEKGTTPPTAKEVKRDEISEEIRKLMEQ
jgi:HK97 family phage portal protein